MSMADTVIVADVGEDDTVIESRFGPAAVTAAFVEPVAHAQASLPFEGSGRASSSEQAQSASEKRPARVSLRRATVLSSFKLHYREIAGVTAFLALSAGLGVVAYQQWRLTASLRSALDELGPAQSAQTVPGSTFDGEDHRSQLAERAARRERVLGEIPAEELDALETRGAALVATNNRAQALVHYRMLADRFPGDPFYRDIVTALQSKQGCDYMPSLPGGVCP